MIKSILLSILVSTYPQAASSQTQRVPAFALKDVRGRMVRLSDYKGKVVLLNFWATWCVPCRVEIPELVKLQKEYQGQGLQIVGITVQKYQQRTVRSLAKRLAINYPILFGTQKVTRLFGLGEVLPVTIIIDREGIMRDRILGIMELEEFEEKVKPLF